MSVNIPAMFEAAFSLARGNRWDDSDQVLMARVDNTDYCIVNQPTAAKSKDVFDMMLRFCMKNDTSFTFCKDFKDGLIDQLGLDSSNCLQWTDPNSQKLYFFFTTKKTGFGGDPCLVMGIRKPRSNGNV